MIGVSRVADIPIVSDFLPGYQASSGHGVGLPKDAPAEIRKAQQSDQRGLADIVMKAGLDELGGTALRGSAGDFGKLVSVETDKWGKLVKFETGLTRNYGIIGHGIPTSAPRHTQTTEELP
jgi:hypothetical protein